jgi:carbon monoxide dehydrogenase subunit G
VKLDIGGNEAILAPVEALWAALNDPKVLTRCIPGCKGMIEIGPDAYKVDMQLKVAAVGGSFEGEISLSEKEPPRSCSIRISGAGTLGHGKGAARFDIELDGENGSRLIYKGNGEIGGLVAGVGQRVLAGVSKHLIGRFFVALRKEFERPVGGGSE